LAFGELVELEHEGQRYAAVLQSERPLLDTFEAKVDAESLRVSWSACDLPPAMSAVVWDPAKVLDAPTAHSLSHDELASGASWKPCASLPGNRWTAISFAHSASGFFQRVLRFAGRRSPGMEPISILLDRSNGTLISYEAKPAGWSKFLHHVTLMRWYQKEGWEQDLERWIAEVEKTKDLDIESAFAMVHDLQQMVSDEATSGYDQRWAELILRAIIRVLGRRVRENPAPALIRGYATGRLDALLTMGIPVGQLYPSAWIATCEPLPDGCPYPVQYICDLWLLGTSRRSLESQLSTIGASMPNDFEAMQMEAASRVIQFHRDKGMPPLSAFLPLASRTATVQTTDRWHHHGFALPPLPASLECVTDLWEILGLQDKAIDCQATCDDQFFEERQRFAQFALGPGRAAANAARSMAKYSLYWSADEHRWVIETPQCSPATCCYTNGQPLVVEPVQPADFANSTIREALNQFSKQEQTRAGFELIFAFLQKYRDALVRDAISGPLHAELFKPAEMETKELFGGLIPVETRAGLTSLGTIAWQLAWIDRVTAWQGVDAILERGIEMAGEQLEFLHALAQAMAAWPNLMRRTLALAELVYWTLYRGGLGLAARFRGPYTEKELATLRRMAWTTESAQQQPSDIPTSNDHIERIMGIIVGYDAGTGVILLHHPSSPSLDATVCDYLKHGNAEKHRFAGFRWKTLNTETRDALQQTFAQFRKSDRRQGATLADVMCGLGVTCEVEKTPTWKATEIVVHFEKRAIRIPKHRRRSSL
jgi:hypothetical protein